MFISLVLGVKNSQRLAGTLLIYNTTGVDAFQNSTCSKVLARLVCQVVITQVVGLMVLKLSLVVNEIGRLTFF